MMHSNMIVGITIFRGSFVFSISRVKVFASLTSAGSLAVGPFDLVYCSPSVVGFVSVFKLVSKCRNVVVGLSKIETKFRNSRVFPGPNLSPRLLLL